MWLMFSLLVLAYAFLVLWYHWAWQQLDIYPGAPRGYQPHTVVTVLVPARNEAHNIGACLQALGAQQYPHALLEVIVIDDASEDDTVLKVQEMASFYEFIRCLSMPADQQLHSHKKRAIEAGIHTATGDLIVCTDADCTMGADWLLTLVHCYEQGGRSFIAAPVVYETEPSILSVFQTLDFLTLQGITGGSVSQRFHTMCNGANIAYSKKAFLEVNGFEGIDQLPTGDDMLLMYKMYRKNPDGVVWLKSQAAIVHTMACASWTAFFQQRIRWASKAAYYDDKRIFYVLLLVYLLNVSMLGLVIAGFWCHECWYGLLAGIIVKTATEIFFLRPVAKFFNRSKWLAWFPFLQLHHIVYTVAAGWLGRFSSYQWKGRSISKPSKLSSR